MPSFGMNTRPEVLVPLIDCVGDTLSQVMPDIPEALLQFIDVMKLMSVANVSMHASMPKEDILAFTTTQEYTHKFIKPQLAIASRIDDVHLFVRLSVCLSVCL